MHAVHTAAFGREAEARLVDALREHPAFVRELSLVAVAGGSIVGHVLFTRVEVVGGAARSPALALAPLAIAPPVQRLGIGSALVRRGIEECRSLGHGVLIVLGSPLYYGRFGFERASSCGIEALFPGAGEHLRVLEALPGALRGVRGMVEYAEPFRAF